MNAGESRWGEENENEDVCVCVCAWVWYSTMLELPTWYYRLRGTVTQHRTETNRQQTAEPAAGLKYSHPRAVGKVPTVSPRAGTLATKRKIKRNIDIYPKLPFLERSMQVPRLKSAQLLRASSPHCCLESLWNAGAHELTHLQPHLPPDTPYRTPARKASSEPH